MAKREVSCPGERRVPDENAVTRLDEKVQEHQERSEAGQNQATGDWAERNAAKRVEESRWDGFET